MEQERECCGHTTHSNRRRRSPARGTGEKESKVGTGWTGRQKPQEKNEAPLRCRTKESNTCSSTQRGAYVNLIHRFFHTICRISVCVSPLCVGSFGFFFSWNYVLARLFDHSRCNRSTWSYFGSSQEALDIDVEFWRDVFDARLCTRSGHSTSPKWSPVKLSNRVPLSIEARFDRTGPRER